MPNWNVFDDQTSDALRSRLPEQTIVELPESLALAHTLRRNQTTVAILPGGGMGQAALAVIRWNRVVPPSPPLQANTRAGGFLGLTDEPVFEEEPPAKKGWWKRWWEN